MSHKILTTKPATRKFITSLKRDILYFLSLTNGLTNVTIRIYYTDSTDRTETVDISAFLESYAFQVPLDWAVINGYEPAKTIQYFEVYIDESIDKITYVPEDPISASNTQKYFFYLNSLGGFDSLVCQGDHQEGIEAEEIVGQRDFPIQHGYITPEYEVRNQLSRSIFTANTGNKPKAEIAALMDMIHKNVIYEVVNVEDCSFLIPCRIITKASSLPTEWQNLKNLTFQYRYNYDNRSFNRR